MAGTIPGGNILGGNFPGGILQEGVWWVGIFLVGIFPGRIFLEQQLHANCKILLDEKKSCQSVVNMSSCQKSTSAEVV